MSIFNRRKIHISELPVVAKHLDQFGHRYGPELCSSEYLDVLKSLLSERVVDSQLLEETGTELSGGSVNIVGLGITGFLDLDTAKHILDNPPDMPIVEFLYQKEGRGEHIFLRQEEVRHHNHGDGLVLVFLHFSTPEDSASRPDGHNVVVDMQSGFRHQYGGYHCRMLFHPIPKGDQRGADSLVALGFRTISDSHTFAVFDLDKLDSIPYHPFVSLRRTQEPRLGLSTAEKSLLLAALWGRSDAEIASDLYISVETVRKRWRNIFRRFDVHPQIHLFRENTDPESKTRGAEKRTLVLKYIDSHLEEIRP